MARVTSEGGAILIVSHLNANEAKGMAWLEDVVFNGLKANFLDRCQSKLRRKTKDTNLTGELNPSGDYIVGDNDDKEYIWSVEVHGGSGAQPNTSTGDKEDIDADVGDEKDDELLVYGPAVYIVRKKSVSAAIARKLFGKRKEKTGLEEVKEGSDGDDDDYAELIEMPPVKLSFLSYDGE